MFSISSFLSSCVLLDSVVFVHSFCEYWDSSAIAFTIFSHKLNNLCNCTGFSTFITINLSKHSFNSEKFPKYSCSLVCCDCVSNELFSNSLIDSISESMIGINPVAVKLSRFVPGASKRGGDVIQKADSITISLKISESEGFVLLRDTFSVKPFLCGGLGTK